MRIGFGQPIQLHHFQQFVHTVCDVGFAWALVFRQHLQAKSHVVKHRHVAEQSVVLKHKTHAALAHRFVADFGVAKIDFAIVVGFQAGDDAQ